MTRLFYCVFFLLMFFLLRHNARSEFTDKGFSFRAAVPNDTAPVLRQPVNLTCQHDIYSPTSLRIYMAHTDNQLSATVFGDSLLYQYQPLRCTDKGTYICQYIHNSSKNTSVDIPIPACALRLCPGETQGRVVHAELGGHLVFSFCVIIYEYFNLLHVFRDGDSDKRLPHQRYTLYTSKRVGPDLRFDVQIELNDLEEEDFGLLTFRLQNVVFHWETLDYKLFLHEKGFRFQIPGQSDFLLERYAPVNMTCKSFEHPASSLSMYVLYTGHELPSVVIDNTLVYHIAQLQCRDMTTYICQFDNNTAENKSVDVRIKACAPQLCPGSDEERTIYASLNETLLVSFCLVASESFSVVKIFVAGEDFKTLPRTKYTYQVSKVSGQRLYHSVDIFIYNIDEDDFGIVSVRFMNTESPSSLRSEYKFLLKESGVPHISPEESLQETVFVEPELQISTRSSTDDVTISSRSQPTYDDTDSTAHGPRQLSRVSVAVTSVLVVSAVLLATSAVLCFFVVYVRRRRRHVGGNSRSRPATASQYLGHGHPDFEREEQRPLSFSQQTHTVHHIYDEPVDNMLHYVNVGSKTRERNTDQELRGHQETGYLNVRLH